MYSIRLELLSSLWEASIKFGLITQARYGSSRLPGKISLEVGNQNLLSLHLQRAGKCLEKNLIKIVATTTEKEAEQICKIAEENQFLCFRGQLEDVLDRFYQAALPYDLDAIIRITSDCPLFDSKLLDSAINLFKDKNVDYLSNTLNPTFPDGMDLEIFSMSALEMAWRNAKLKSDREHVTPYIWKNSDFHNETLFKAYSMENNEDHSKYRLTVDSSEDYELIKAIVSNIGINKSWQEYVSYLNDHKNLIELNSHQTRNDGYKKSVAKDDI